MRVLMSSLMASTLFISFSAAPADTKDQWICVAEAAATLHYPSPDTLERFTATAYDGGLDQYLVSEDGVKQIGEDRFLAKPCIITENSAKDMDSYVNCGLQEKDAKPGVAYVLGGWFTKSADNKFQLYFRAGVRPMTYALIGGVCSRL